MSLCLKLSIVAEFFVLFVMLCCCAEGDDDSIFRVKNKPISHRIFNVNLQYWYFYIA